MLRHMTSAAPTVLMRVLMRQSSMGTVRGADASSRNESALPLLAPARNDARPWQQREGREWHTVTSALSYAVIAV